MTRHLLGAAPSILSRKTPHSELDLAKKRKKHYELIYSKKTEANMTANKHKGSTFDSFLKEENLLENAEAIAIKRIIAFELEKTMKKAHVTKTKMAQKMHTSPSALDRLLDPTNTSISLGSLVKVAHILGKKLQIKFA